MPRRQKLIWFALGALTSMIFTLAVALLPTRLVLDHTSTTYLVLEEPMSGDAKKDAGEAVLIADRAGRLMKDCEARFFEITAYRDDQVPTAQLPIIQQNVNALVCVIGRAEREGFTITTHARWGDPNDIARELQKTDRLSY